MVARKLLFLLHLFVQLAFARSTVRVNWDIGYVFVNRDNTKVRRAIGVNGKLPIPPIHLAKHDTLILTVKNSLNVHTSIHAHGLFQNGTNYLDGPDQVTQCGLPSNHTFTYTYKNISQSGTYWLHAHSLHQNADGARTPLVISDPEDVKYPEYVLWFEDWYPVEFAVRMEQTMDPNQPFPPPVTYPNMLLNGHNPQENRTVLKFEVGKTYRIRLINMSTTEWFKFNIPGYKLQVIETDGAPTTLTAVDGVDMGPGQRYSVLVTAQDRLASTFTVALHASFIPLDPLKNPLVYNGTIEHTASEPAPIDTNNLVWTDDIYINGRNVNLLPVDRQIKLTLNGSLFTDHITRDIINNITYTLPKVPTLYSALSLGDLATNTSLYGPQTHSIVLNHLENIELLVYNPNTIPHPMHLHGHRFQVVEYGPIPPWMMQEAIAASLSFAEHKLPPKLVHPAVVTNLQPNERDTVVLPSLEYVKIRFCADSPGVWLFHCHLDVHHAMGNALTLIEAPLLLQKQTVLPKEMLEMCRLQGIRATGNAVGNPGFDLSGLPPAPTMVP
ncbi:multicopper oxidase-domain-containing protein [Coemansia spiralis]|nr:multicopper oxidase-domain-containing protein [Coemansia spiralis]